MFKKFGRVQHFCAKCAMLKHRGFERRRRVLVGVEIGRMMNMAALNGEMTRRKFFDDGPQLFR